MGTLTATTLIEAPIEHCFDCCRDVALLRAYLQHSQPHVTLTIDPPPREAIMQPGDEFVFSATKGLLQEGFRVRLERIDPPHRLVLSGSQALQSRYVLTYTLSAVPGGTEVALLMELTYKSGIMGQLLAPLAVVLQRAALNMWMPYLKAAAEESAESGERSRFTGSVQKTAHPVGSEGVLSTERVPVGFAEPRMEGISGGAVLLFLLAASGLAWLLQ